MFGDRPAKMKWPRSQRFVLSERGLSAEQAYREVIVAARSQEGRDAFDAARLQWAASLGLEPDDGLYLAEVREGATQLPRIVEALQTCGKTKSDAISAVERLVEAGFVIAQTA